MGAKRISSNNDLAAVTDHSFDKQILSLFLTPPNWYYLNSPKPIAPAPYHVPILFGFIRLISINNPLRFFSCSPTRLSPRRANRFDEAMPVLEESKLPGARYWRRPRGQNMAMIQKQQRTASPNEIIRSWVNDVPIESSLPIQKRPQLGELKNDRIRLTRPRALARGATVATIATRCTRSIAAAGGNGGTYGLWLKLLGILYY